MTRADQIDQRLKVRGGACQGVKTPPLTLHRRPGIEDPWIGGPQVQCSHFTVPRTSPGAPIPQSLTTNVTI